MCIVLNTYSILNLTSGQCPWLCGKALRMRQNTFYGSALIGGALLLIGMGLTHPTGARLLTTREALEQFTLVDHMAHGLAIAGVCLGLVGLAGFSRFLGTSRPTVAAA